MGATTSSFALYPTDEGKELDCSPENCPAPPEITEAVPFDSRRCAQSNCSSSAASSSGGGGAGGSSNSGGFSSRIDSGSGSGSSCCSTASSYCEERPQVDDSQGPSRKRTTIESLPDEVLIKVLAAVNSSASSPLDVVLPSMINRRWRRASRDREALKRACRGGVAVRARQWCEGAYIFLRRLCENGCLEAAFMLAMILFYCIPGAQFEGGRLLMHSAREGHAASLYTASILSFNGSGLGAQHKDARMGVALCARAAALGHTEAMRELGHCLIDGYGVQRDSQEGWRMLLEAQATELAPQTYLLSLLAATSASAACDSFSSAAATRACNAGPFGNSLPLPAAEQESAVQLLLARDWRAAPATPISSDSASASGAVAGGDDDMAGDEVADSSDSAFLSAAGLSPLSPSSVLSIKSPRSPAVNSKWQSQPPTSAKSAAAAAAITTPTPAGSKQAVVQKLLAGLASGAFRLTDAHVSALEPALAALQTSLRPAPIHPAHVFVREWRALKGLASADDKQCADDCAAGAATTSAAAGAGIIPQVPHPATAGAPGVAAAAAGAEASLVAGGNARAGVCSRASCGRPETRPLEFWRCSTCWRVRYCSRSCQVHDWRERHGRQCGAAAVEGREGVSAHGHSASAHRPSHGMGVH